MIATTVEVRTKVSFQNLANETANAEINVDPEVRASPNFSLMPSWIKKVSAVILVVTSPAPRWSK